MFILAQVAAAAQNYGVPAPNTQILESRKWGIGLSSGAALQAKRSDVETDPLPIDLLSRRQLNRRFALDPTVSFRLPRKGQWRAEVDLTLRGYVISFGRVHLLGLVGLQAHVGSVPAPLRFSYLNLDVFGGGGAEYTASRRVSIGLNVQTPFASAGRRWSNGVGTSQSVAPRTVETRLEAHYWL